MNYIIKKFKPRKLTLKQKEIINKNVRKSASQFPESKKEEKDQLREIVKNEKNK